MQAHTLLERGRSHGCGHDNNLRLTPRGGTSDLRFIRKISPGLEFGLVGKTMHKVDENVSIADLKKLTKIYQSILVNYFSSKK